MRFALLVPAALALIASSPVAQTYTDQASASIQATATVVQTLGVTSPEDNFLRADGNPDAGVIDVAVNDPANILSMHRMLVRYPSLGSVVVSIESDSDDTETFALAQWHDSGGEADLLHPGAILLDLNDVSREVAVDGSDCVVTLIYSEN